MNSVSTPVDFSRNVFCVMGLPFDALTMEEARNRVCGAAQLRQSMFFSTANLNFIVSARTDEAFRDSVIRSQLSLPDGMPVVWAARLLGLPIRERVPGAGLFDAISKSSERQPVKVYFFGGPDGAAQAASETVNQQNSGVVCVGFHSPGFVPVESMSGGEYTDRINRADPDFVVVSLGAMKGQAWIERNRPLLNAPIISHLGAVVNFAAGSVSRAPLWMQRVGLEWLWRIKEEPKLWKRYAADGIAFIQIFFEDLLPLWRQRLLARKDVHSAPPRVEFSESVNVVEMKLSGICNAANSASLRSAFARAAEAELRIRLDLSEVVTIDSSVMGLLLLLYGHQKNIGRSLELNGLTDELRRQFKLHGTEFLLLQKQGPRSVHVKDIARRHA